uniref:Large ribosomal subunit protein bL21c n=1 Tax=Sphagnum cuspidatum TaxID=41840 RepID=A0A172NBJ9_SPHCU|nr:ribosomal protein L21 [Sphagnum cuspidatum]
MGTYAIIETGGEQLRVEPGRFYDVRRFTPSKPNLLGPNAKVLIYRVLMIRHESMINIGHPWLRGAVVKGRILHSHLGDKTIIYKMRPKKKTRRKSGHRHNSARFVVDSIHLNGEKLHK